MQLQNLTYFYGRFDNFGTAFFVSMRRVVDARRSQEDGRTARESKPNDHPNDSTKSPERFRSNDSVNTPERLFTSKRTNMLQVLFIIGCLLVPAFNDWTEKCRNNN